MKVYIESHNIVSSLGFSSAENFDQMVLGKTGIKSVNDVSFWDEELPLSLVNKDQLNAIIPDKSYTHFEKLMLASAKQALNNSSVDASSNDTLFILSTTKGNVELLSDENTKHNKETNLWHSANLLTTYFNNPNKAQTISNACISGLMAILIGSRLIKAGKYNNVVVVGADAISKFIVSGFQSFHSLSPEPCKPFDVNRDGLSLGEGAGTVVLTNNEDIIEGQKIIVDNGGISNDANHISGPSRTGEGLLIAINNALVNGSKPDFISAHGTATPYNDDMESKAIYRASLSEIPVNSLKGYIGHTLGAAGVIEAIIGFESLKRNQILPTLGLIEQGVAEDICINKELQNKPLSSFLKLVSGFGGCNTSVLFKKDE